jgi:hypothetical protein
MQQHLQDDLTIYSGELQQIWQTPEHNTILGTRFQYGDFDTDNVQTGHQPMPFLLFQPMPHNKISLPVQRISVYGYHQWQVFDPLQLIGGVAYDRLTFPGKFSDGPFPDTEQTEHKVSPKAGLIWTPLDNTTFRFAYTRSLGGASLDQSYQLEPSQVAGFIQSYRSIIPESVVGPVPGANFETYGFSLEQKFSTGTYLGVSGELLNSDVKQTVGAFNYFHYWSPASNFHPDFTEDLNYREESLLVTANQLVGKNGRLVRAIVSARPVKRKLRDVPAGGLVPIILQPSQRQEAILNQVDLLVVYNHPCGFFAQGEAHWYGKTTADIPANRATFLAAQCVCRLPVSASKSRNDARPGLLNITTIKITI